MAPRSTLPSAADVVVVGAGAIGLAIAYELSLRGVSVVVIERTNLGDGTSFGNAGFVARSHVLPVAEPAMLATAVRGLFTGAGAASVRVSLRLSYLRWLANFLGNCRPVAVAAAAPVLAELGNLSAGLFEERLKAENINCAYAPNGLLKVYGSRKAFAEGCARADCEGRFGVSTQMFPARQAREKEPTLNDTVSGAIFYPDDAGLDPGRFLAGLAAALKRRGGQLVCGTEVLDVRIRAGQVQRLVTSQGDIRAKEVVLAAGSWTPALAAKCDVHIPIQPAKGYSLTVAKPQRAPRQRMLLGEEHVAIAPMGDRLRLSGRFELGQFNRAVPPKRLAEIEAKARSRLDLDEKLTVLERWAGFRPVTPDGLPIVGRVAAANLMIACGHAMLGVTLAPATGRLAAQTLCGETPELDLAPLSPARFQ